MFDGKVDHPPAVRYPAAMITATWLATSSSTIEMPVGRALYNRQGCAGDRAIAATTAVGTGAERAVSGRLHPDCDHADAIGMLRGLRGDPSPPAGDSEHQGDDECRRSHSTPLKAASGAADTLRDARDQATRRTTCRDHPCKTEKAREK